MEAAACTEKGPQHNLMTGHCGVVTDNFASSCGLRDIVTVHDGAIIHGPGLN